MLVTSLNLAMFFTFSRDLEDSDVTLLADELIGRLFSKPYALRGELEALLESRCWLLLLVVGGGTEMVGGCVKWSPLSPLYPILERGEEFLS